MPSDEWRILAEEAAQEKDPKKLLDIVNSLTTAIDRELTKKTTRQRHIPPDAKDGSSVASSNNTGV